MPADQGAERSVYLLQQPILDNGGVALAAMLRAIWKGRWMVLVITLLCGACGLTYVILATEWFRAEVTLLPRDSKAGSGLSAQLAQFGGLASLAGISLGATDKQEPLAILQSHAFLQQFIERKELLPVLLSDKWDVGAKMWKKSLRVTPDVRDAVKYFEEKVWGVSEDKKTGLITLSVEWKDAKEAAVWANELSGQINEVMRSRALNDATINADYLQEELRKTSVLSLQQAIGRLLESEMQKLMVARGGEEYAFRIVDRAEIPKLRSKPNGIAVVALSLLLGAFLSCLIALISNIERDASKGS